MAYSECPDMLNRVMVRDNIGMVILLQTKEKVFGNFVCSFAFLVFSCFVFSSFSQR